MSENIIGDELWAEMDDGQKLNAVLAGRATLKQISEGLLDGSPALRDACQNFLAHSGAVFENSETKAEAPVEELNGLAAELTEAARKQKIQTHTRSKTPRRAVTQTSRQRFGLPQGFVPRLQRFGRAVLLESNVYRLPDGTEFIPCRPSGTLGGRQHLYALVTGEQFLQNKRGSVYVRTDGRIFDYSVDRQDENSELFDTGYTIYDLERTGRYAPELHRRRARKKTQPPKANRATAG